MEMVGATIKIPVIEGPWEPVAVRAAKNGERFAGVDGAVDTWTGFDETVSMYIILRPIPRPDQSVLDAAGVELIEGGDKAFREVKDGDYGWVGHEGAIYKVTSAACGPDPGLHHGCRWIVQPKKKAWTGDELWEWLAAHKGGICLSSSASRGPSWYAYWTDSQDCQYHHEAYLPTPRAAVLALIEAYEKAERNKP